MLGWAERAKTAAEEAHLGWKQRSFVLRSDSVDPMHPLLSSLPALPAWLPPSPVVPNAAPHCCLPPVTLPPKGRYTRLAPKTVTAWLLHCHALAPCPSPPPPTSTISPVRERNSFLAPTPSPCLFHVSEAAPLTVSFQTKPTEHRAKTRHRVSQT